MSDARDRFALRLDEAGVSTTRFIPVQSGEKGTRMKEHQQSEQWLPASSPRLNGGNYGVHPGGTDESERWLVEFDIDDYDGEVDRDALDDLPATFTVESPHTQPDDPGHRYYAVDRDDVDALEELAGSMNPEPSWGEIKAKGKYVVGPGSQLDGCSKEWCEECAKPDGGWYRIAEDREIAALSREQLESVLQADPEIETEDDDTPKASELFGYTDDESEDEHEDYTGPELTEDQVEDALDHVDEMLDYSEWLRVGFAVHDWDDGATGKQRFEEWSQSNEERWNRDRDEGQRIINDIWDNDRPNGSVTVGTLVHYAKQGGWTPPSPSTPQGSNGGDPDAADLDSEKTLSESIIDHPLEWMDPDTQTITVHPVADHDEQEVAAMFEEGDVPNALRDELLFDGDADDARQVVREFLSNSDDWHVETVGNDVPSWGAVQWEFSDNDSADSDYGRYKAVQILTEEYDILTEAQSEHIYWYDDDCGVFAETGEQELRNAMDEGMDHRFKRSRAENILYQIASKTFIYDELGGPEGYLCVENGVLDLEDRDLLDHDPEYQFLSHAGTAYDEDAECSRFLEFLEESVHEDDITKLQEYAGYCLMHWDQPYKRALMIMGPTDSGKSVWLNTIQKLLGGRENVAAESLHDLVETRWGAARLYGRFANIFADLDPSVVENPGTFKTLTGDDAMLSAERKREQKFEFEVTQKLMFSANQVPEARNADDAFHNRWVHVTFPETVPEHEQDKELEDKLAEELPGILNWAIDGYDRLRENHGFTDERTKREKRDHWDAYGNPLARFKSSCLSINGDANEFHPRRAVYDLFQEFCEQKGLAKLTFSKFGGDLGDDPDITKGRRRWGDDGDLTYVYQGFGIKKEALEGLGVDYDDLVDDATDDETV